jgi:DHA1 family inner membrane transport protein
MKPDIVLSPLAVTAMVSSALIGEYSLLIMPFILTAMMEIHGINEVTAGRLISAQLFAMALASVLVTRVVARIPRRILATLATLTIILANSLCMLGYSMTSLVIGRIGTGLGEGTLMAVAGAVIAASAAPHRIFSIVGLVVAVVASIALVSVPFIVGLFGHQGTFGLLALCALMSLVLLPWLPSVTPSAPGVAQPTGVLDRSALLVLLAFAMLWIGASGLWVFAERLGDRIGLGLNEIGTSLAVGQLVGIAGPLAADRFALRMGLVPSLVGGCLGMAVGGLIFVFGTNEILYALGAALLSFFVMFLVPCFRSLMARMDPGGRVVSASAAFYTLAFALSPAIVTVILDPADGYTSVGLFCTGVFVLGALLVGFSTR